MPLVAGTAWYLFAFSIKSSSQYACALEQVRRHRDVVWQIGEPVGITRVANG
jgi:hypothetical protein